MVEEIEDVEEGTEIPTINSKPPSSDIRQPVKELGLRASGRPPKEPASLTYDDKKDWREAIDLCNITDKKLHWSIMDVLEKHERMYSSSLGTISATHHRIKLRTGW